MKTCRYCSKEFDEFSTKKRLYCSKRCYRNAKSMRHYRKHGALKNGAEPPVCKLCGKAYIPTGYRQKFCSVECGAESQRKYLTIPECLEDASRKLDKNIGYVRVYCPMHPKANTWGYVYEHRLIAEGMVGRHLTGKEHVHHINGKRWDNRPENLQVLSASEHSKVTQSDNAAVSQIDSESGALKMSCED